MEPMPARKPAPDAPPAAPDRKPFPPKRHKVAPAEDPVARRNAPGETTSQLAAEINRQLDERGMSKTEFATRVGWNKSRVNKLLRPEGPTQAMTVDDLAAIGRALGVDPSTFLVGAGISSAQVDLIDAVYSDARLGKASRQMIVRAVQLARTVDEQAASNVEGD